jgi:hypothetical protein
VELLVAAVDLLFLLSDHLPMRCDSFLAELIQLFWLGWFWLIIVVFGFVEFEV